MRACAVQGGVLQCRKVVDARPDVLTARGRSAVVLALLLAVLLAVVTLPGV